MRNRLRHYAALHAQNLLAAIGRIVRHPVGSSMTIIVIAIALALPSGLRVLLNNAEVLSGSWQGAIDFSVYLDRDVDAERARELAGVIEAREDVLRAVFISRDDAMAEFRAYSGFGDALDALAENPLPHAIVVRPVATESSEVQALAVDLEELAESDFVQLDTAWLQRLSAMLTLGRRFVDIVTVLLGFAVVLVIGNTIRLEINNRHEEIEIVKLIGGSSGFIRRPFLYLGLIYGLMGGLLAGATIAAGLGIMGSPTRALAELYGSDFSLTGLSLSQTLVLLLGGPVLGWAGAGIATAYHLNAIEPH